MIAGVRGKLEAIGDSWIILAVGGVSLKVFTPATTLQSFGGVGSAVHLHTHLLVKEEELALYGFPTPEALRLFQLLLTVSGIGPRYALSLLNSASPETIALALATGDTATLQRAPGIGRKTAERLVLELREKFARDRALVGKVPSSAEDEALAALLSLGYSVAEARDALQRVPKDQPLPAEEQLRIALQQLAHR
ncbi:MAG: Holliday junction branch migration protein RuvA [Dehalococcoidia bacterium]|nr:Holliday junction branch migration protein RuvA [Dehalococcoidia bacterium]